MQIVVNNYHGDDLSWLPDGEVFIYDKKELNVGYNIYDYMDWIVNNYDNLHDVILFTKGNMLKRHITQEEWEIVKNNKTFTPLLTNKHETDGSISKYENGLYCERNDSWYLYTYPTKFYFDYIDFARDFNLPMIDYLPFAPGGCYIVTKENIHKHQKGYYQLLRDIVSWHQTPGEAHLVERSLYNIWK